MFPDTTCTIASVSRSDALNHILEYGQSHYDPLCITELPTSEARRKEGSCGQTRKSSVVMSESRLSAHCLLE